MLSNVLSNSVCPIGLPLRSRSNLLITCMITNRIGLHSVLLTVYSGGESWGAWLHDYILFFTLMSDRFRCAYSQQLWKIAFRSNLSSKLITLSCRFNWKWKTHLSKVTYILTYQETLEQFESMDVQIGVFPYHSYLSVPWL